MYRRSEHGIFFLIYLCLDYHPMVFNAQCRFWGLNRPIRDLEINEANNMIFKNTF